MSVLAGFFKSPSYRVLNQIQIEGNNLKENYSFFQSENPQAKICPVLKSNAYGYGLKLIGGFVDREIKPEFICVDSLFEAYELEKIGVKSQILILGYTFPENFKHKKINFHLPLFDPETLKILSEYQPGIKVHLKIDSGMNRLGLKIDQVESFIKKLKKYPKVIVEGIYSHLATGDNPSDSGFCQKQAVLFREVIKTFEAAGFEFKYKHLCATAGCLRIKEPEFNLIRLGLGFYGYSPFSPDTSEGKILYGKLKPALKFVSHLVEIKKIMSGETIGYGQTFKAKKEMVVGVLPLGYFDAVDRRLSNKGFVKVNDEFCPIVGNVSMNITMIDVTKVKDVKVGQEVVVFDNNVNSKNFLVKEAQLVGTIPYEMLCRFSQTTRRILV